MPSLSQLRNQKLRKLQNASRFKNNFLNVWLEHGDFFDVDGKKYLRKIRIDGDSTGAIEMSKVLGDPELHNNIEDGDISSVDLVLNFNKLLTLDQNMISDWLQDYKNRVSAKNFNGLYFRITENRVVDHYFVNEDGDRIVDDLLDELSFDLAERERVEYYDIGCNCIDFGVRLVDDGGIEQTIEIIYSENQSTDDIFEKMNALDDMDFVNYSSDGVTYESAFTLPLIRDKVLSFATDQGIGGDDLFADFQYLELGWFRGYFLSYEDAKRMNAESFLKLIIEILDFDAHATSSSFWRKAFIGVATIVAGAIYIVYTGDVYGGFSLMTGIFGEVMDSDELRIITAILSLGSMGMGESGEFLLSNIGYTDAINLVMNIGSLYYSMQVTTPELDEEAVDTDQGVYLLYEAPYNIYDDLYDYEKLISVTL